MPQSGPAERREVRYSGHVQGVGFRYRCREIAARFQVVGYVRNLPDGRVELIVEGEPRELDRFLSDVGSAFEVHIRQADVVRGPGSGQFAEFVIRH